MRVASLCAAGLSFVLLTMPRDMLHAQTTTELRPAASFESIPDQNARSRALFSEISKVLMNPRCMNCHPAGDRPTQGNDLHPHEPPVFRAAGFCHRNLAAKQPCVLSFGRKHGRQWQ